MPSGGKRGAIATSDVVVVLTPDLCVGAVVLCRDAGRRSDSGGQKILFSTKCAWNFFQFIGLYKF